MGRTLESLKKGIGPMLRPEGGPSAPLGDMCITEWAVSEQQAPFIEVGPGKMIEGSAEVLATHSAQPKQPPHPPTEKALAQSPLMAQLSEARPLAVAYEPWNGPIAGARIAPEIIVYHQPVHAISKQYVELIQKMAPAEGRGVLLVAGMKPQVGATTVLVNLAVAGALSARRVIVVDTHLDRPGIAQRLGFDPECGLEHVLSGKAALDEAILQTVVPSLHVLPAKERSLNIQLSHDATAWLLGLLRMRFELVLCDGPTLDSPALAPLAPCCDALYLVAQRGESLPLDRSAVHALTRRGAHLRGILHTHMA
jgi:Mrp family chromosome partitioning ATPase